MQAPTDTAGSIRGQNPRHTPTSGDGMLGWAEAHIAASGRRLARLDAAADNARLQRWYADRGHVEVRHRDIDDGAWFSVTLREKRLG